MIRLIVLSSLLLLLVSCRTVERRIYDVHVKNESPGTVLVWLTKDGPLWEEGWKSPEDLAVESPRMREPIAGVLLPPGERTSTGRIRGRFEPATQAILRIYDGEFTFNELLAMSRKDPARTDVVLQPGENDIVITTARTGELNIDHRHRPID
jgi:hypothetical protein